MSELPPDWPTVHKYDDGIRPAGKPDECFYCKRKVGHLHAFGCVMVTKIVELEVTAFHKKDIPTPSKGVFQIDQPWHWDATEIESRFNTSTWCGSNILETEIYKIAWDDPQTHARLEALTRKGNCLCGGVIRVRYLRTIDNTPRRDLHTEELLS